MGTVRQKCLEFRVAQKVLNIKLTSALGLLSQPNPPDKHIQVYKDTPQTPAGTLN